MNARRIGRALGTGIILGAMMSCSPCTSDGAIDEQPMSKRTSTESLRRNVGDAMDRNTSPPNPTPRDERARERLRTSVVEGKLGQLVREIDTSEIPLAWDAVLVSGDDSDFQLLIDAGLWPTSSDVRCDLLRTAVELSRSWAIQRILTLTDLSEARNCRMLGLSAIEHAVLLGKPVALDALLRHQDGILMDDDTAGFLCTWMKQIGSGELLPYGGSAEILETLQGVEMRCESR